MFIRRCNERCMKYQEDFQRVEREASTNFGYAGAVGCYKPYYRLCSRTTAYKIPVWLDIAYGKFEFLVLLECRLISDFLSTRSMNSAKVSIKRTVVTKQNLVSHKQPPRSFVESLLTAASPSISGTWRRSSRVEKFSMLLARYSSPASWLTPESKLLERKKRRQATSVNAF